MCVLSELLKFKKKKSKKGAVTTAVAVGAQVSGCRGCARRPRQEASSEEEEFLATGGEETPLQLPTVLETVR